MPFEGDVLGWRGTFCDVELLFFPWLDGICILQAARERLNPQCRAGQEVKRPLCHAQDPDWPQTGRARVFPPSPFLTLSQAAGETPVPSRPTVPLQPSPEQRGSSH